MINRLTRRIIRSSAGIFMVAAIVVILADGVKAGGFESKEYDIGLEAGLWLPGTISVEDIDLDKDGSLLFRAFADSFIMPKFAVGAYFNYSSFTVSYGGYDADADFYEFGIALKPRFILNATTAVKPGLNIGYRKLSAEGYDDIDGLGLNLSIEVQFMLEGGYVFFIDGGFLSQPVGGNDDADVTWAPIVYLAAGIVF